MMVTPRNLYVAAYGTIGLLIAVTQVIIVPVIPQMLLYTGSILYIASHHSLSMLARDPDTGKAPEVQAVSKQDAMLFPLIGSVALLSIYAAYKFFGKYLVNLLLSTYLTVIGLVALAESIRPVITMLVPEAMSRKTTHLKLRVPFWHQATDEPLALSFGKVDIVAYATSACACVVYLCTKHWSVHNLFAVAFALQAAALISLGRFVVGFILLAGLFLYDIFWVFGTEVMVSVAMQFQGPIKIIFPVSFDPWKQSILGLGDVAIPGIFIAMCLRYDAYRHRSDAKEEQALDSFSSFPKPYFWRVYAAYLLALLVTGVVMLGLGRPQPALLYLVPGVTFTLLGTSYLRGDLAAVLAYNEEDLAPKKEGSKDE